MNNYIEDERENLSGADLECLEWQETFATCEFATCEMEHAKEMNELNRRMVEEFDKQFGGVND